MVQHIEGIAQQALARLGLEDSAIYRISDPGTSQSRVFLYRVSDGRLIAVKVLDSKINARVSLKWELSNRSVLEKYMQGKLADIYWHGSIDDYDVIVYEAIGANSLHGEILQGALSQRQIVDTWTDFLAHITDMWQQSETETAKGASARPYDHRFDRIKSGIETHMQDAFTGDVLDAPVEINGEQYPTLRELLHTLSTEPVRTTSVICHGDPQPSNIIVNPKTGDWKVVDWEWSQNGHDWRMMAAHLYGWWLTRTVRFAEESSMAMDNDVLRIEYETYEDTANDMMRQVTIDHLVRTMNLDAPQHVAALRQYLALLLLGEVRFAHIWGRESHIPYYIAMAHQILRDDGLPTAIARSAQGKAQV